MKENLFGRSMFERLDAHFRDQGQFNPDSRFRAEKRSAQASAHPLSQAQGALVCVLTVFVAGVLSEMHEVRTFAPCKAFLFDLFAFFSSL